MSKRILPLIRLYHNINEGRSVSIPADYTVDIIEPDD